MTGVEYNRMIIFVMKLRNKLKMTIKGKKIPIAKLARLANIHQDTIYKFLSGKTEMTAANLDRLFDILKRMN